MTISPNHAPELMVQTWFNTDRPMTLAPGDVTVIGLHATFEHHDAFNAAVLKAFIHEYRLKFPIALDQPNPASPIPQTMERYQMRGTPSLILIDRHGLVRKHAFG